MARVAGYVSEILFFLAAYTYCIMEWGSPWGWLVGWIPALVIAWVIVGPLATLLFGSIQSMLLLSRVLRGAGNTPSLEEMTASASPAMQPRSASIGSGVSEA